MMAQRRANHYRIVISYTFKNDTHEVNEKTISDAKEFINEIR